MNLTRPASTPHTTEFEHGFGARASPFNKSVEHLHFATALDGINRKSAFAQSLILTGERHCARNRVRDEGSGLSEVDSGRPVDML
jgi:hypothetical protein